MARGKAQLLLTPVVPKVPDVLRIEEFEEDFVMKLVNGFARHQGAADTRPGLPLSVFSEAALRRVGEQWTNALVARAKEMEEQAKRQSENEEPEPQEATP